MKQGLDRSKFTKKALKFLSPALFSITYMVVIF